MDRHHTLSELRELLFIYIDAGDMVPHLGKAGTRHKTHIARSYYRNPQTCPSG